MTDNLVCLLTFFLSHNSNLVKFLYIIYLSLVIVATTGQWPSNYRNHENKRNYYYYYPVCFKKNSKTLTYSSFQNVELPKYLKVVLWVEILLLKESILGWLQSFCMETTEKSSGVEAYLFPGIPLLLLHIVPKMQRNDRKFTKQD